MSITAAFCPISCQTLLDQNALPIRGGRVYAYDAETTNLRSVFKDPALTSAYPSPVKTDAFGRIPPIYVGLGLYKLVVQDAGGSLLYSLDDLPGGTEQADAPSTPSGFVTGDVKAAHTDDLQDGWLPLNGKTIGNHTTGATARANDDTQSLFVKLWNKDASLAVSGGRGVTATADWSASKTIALPDYRGRFFCGVDTMGAAGAAGNITAFTTANPNTIGTQFGGEAVALTTAQLPVVMPAITIAAAGGHSHTGSTNTAGAHVHGGTTDSQGNHNHTYGLSNNQNNFEGGGAGGTGKNAGVNATGTNSAGAHTHNITTDSQGNHSHTLTTSTQADHTHTATSAGGGTQHANTPPAIMGYWHIRL